MNGNFEKDGAAYPFAYLQNGTTPDKTKPGNATRPAYNLTDMRSLERLTEHKLTLKQAEWAANGLNMKLRNGEFNYDAVGEGTATEVYNATLARRDAAIKDAAAVLAVKAQNTI